MSVAGAVNGGLRSFKRGIHPPHRKHFSEAEPIRLFIPRQELQIPLAQHIGAACEAIIPQRSEVKLGQKVADAKAFIAAPIHASVNGKSGLGAFCVLPSGRRVPSIPVKPATEEPAVPEGFLQEFLRRDYDSVEPTGFDPDTICTTLREAGIVGQGGATFPTYVKLKRNPERPVDTILLNGAECEPYLTSDHRLMVECPEAIVTGLLIAQHASGAKRAIVAIEENKPDAIDAMRKVIAKRRGIELAICASKYPMGGERQLIPAVLGRTVPSAPRGLPLDVGVVVVNVATAHSIARAVVHQAPLTHRVVTVTGRGVSAPGNWLVPFGTLFSELIAACGGVTGQAIKVLAGGPMMGPTVPSLNVPVVKGTGGITVMIDDETAHWHETPCIRCGRCIDNCPLYLSPTKIAHAVKHREYEVAQRFDLNACCECGCCSYVCPAQIPLAQYIRAGKNQWRAIQARKQAEEKARQAGAAAKPAAQAG